MFCYYFQKQPFVDAPKNRCSYTFAKIHRKAPVVELLLHKVAKSDSTSATSNERISQRVTSNFLQRATPATSNEQILERVKSDFLQQATSATSNEQILQPVTSDFFATSNFCNE